MFPSPSTTSLKVEGNLSGSMKMLTVKLGKRRKCHDRYRQTLEGEDYCEYTQARNQAKRACKKKNIRDFEKLIAKEAKWISPKLNIYISILFLSFEIDLAFI